MTQYENFTAVQKDTYKRVHDLEHEIMQVIDPAVFVLNQDFIRLQTELDQVRSECDHIWENGRCTVCGACQPFEGGKDAVYTLFY